MEYGSEGILSMKIVLNKILKSNFTKFIIILIIGIIVYNLLTLLIIQNKDFNFLTGILHNTWVRILLILVIPPICIRNIIRDKQRTKTKI